MAENKQSTEFLKFTESLENMRQYAQAIDNIHQLVDLTQNTTKTWTVFNKENLRSYLQSPYATTSQTNLRNLAKFLYTLSFPLRRIVNYFASLPDFSAYKVNLDFSLIEESDEEALLQDYEDACRFVRRMDLEINMFKLLVIADSCDTASIPAASPDTTVKSVPRKSEIIDFTASLPAKLARLEPTKATVLSRLQENKSPL